MRHLMGDIKPLGSPVGLARWAMPEGVEDWWFFDLIQYKIGSNIVSQP